MAPSSSWSNNLQADINITEEITRLSYSSYSLSLSYSDYLHCHLQADINITEEMNKSGCWKSLDPQHANEKSGSEWVLDARNQKSKNRKDAKLQIQMQKMIRLSECLMHRCKYLLMTQIVANRSFWCKQSFLFCASNYKSGKWQKMIGGYKYKC